ncbi:MAG: deoxyribose-phosphate aldolase [Nitratireductor sp.]
MQDINALAIKAISHLDLTNLNDDCTPKDMETLCEKAQTEFGSVAAICIWPKFIKQAVPLLSNTNIQIATVVNFPAGGTNTTAVCKETLSAINDGANEIDLVFPYEAFLQGDVETAQEQIAAVKAVCADKALLKVIIESGELKIDEAITAASLLAIDNGADFIKTSTGKVPVNATLPTARLMLSAILDSKKNIGFKPAGGIKTAQDANDYLQLASELMGDDWATPNTLRFGASSVLENLLAQLKGQDAPTSDAY